jgi:hypothetical protein
MYMAVATIVVECGSNFDIAVSLAYNLARLARGSIGHGSGNSKRLRAS